MARILSRIAIFWMLILTVAACAPTEKAPEVSRSSGIGEPASVLTIGDSLMSWNTLTGNSVPQRLEGILGEEVISKAVPGAKMMLRRPSLIGLSIPQQYFDRNWDIVIMSGGGNDIWQNCACGPCKRTLDNLISADASTGRIPRLVQEDILPTAGHVIFVGYLRTPGITSVTDGCADEGVELERRLERFDQRNARFHFVSAADIVPDGDTSFHSFDLVHPSPRGSNEIARRIARRIFEIRNAAVQVAAE